MKTLTQDEKQRNRHHYINASKVPPYIEVNGQPKRAEEVEVKMKDGKYDSSHQKHWTVGKSLGGEFEFVPTTGGLIYHPSFSLTGENKEKNHVNNESYVVLPLFFPHAELKLKDQVEPKLETVKILNASHGGVLVLGPDGSLKFPHYGILDVSACIHHEPGDDFGTLLLTITALVGGYGNPDMDDPEEYWCLAVDGDGKDSGEVFMGILSARQTFDLWFDNSTGKWETKANYNHQHSLTFIS